MDIRAAAQHYVRKMISPPGIKVLLLDDHTSCFVGLVMSQTEALEQEVFLFDRLSNTTRKMMPHAKAIVFVRPTLENIERLESELMNPLFKDYFIYFTNVVKDNYLERLARADIAECVVQLHEVYADYKPFRSDCFSLDMPSIAELEMPRWNQNVFDEICDGISTVLLSLKRKPSIRYDRNSPIAERIAKEIHSRIDGGGDLFDFRKPGPDPLLLILDRRNDAVTPLMTPWSYEAMVEEHIGIRNNRVSLAAAPDVPQDFTEIVLSTEHDEFYRTSCHLNFGDLGEKLKEVADKLQSHKAKKDKVSTLQEMQSFVQAAGEMRKHSLEVSKHVALVSELSRIVEKRHIMPVSEAEQEVVCHADKAASFKLVYDLIDRQGISNLDRLRLVMLFALKYEGEDERDLRHLLLALKEKGAQEADLKLPKILRQFGGLAVRSQDLFGMDLVTAAAKKIQRGLKGVENVYSQHKPLIHQTLKDLQTGRLREALFPFEYGQAGKDRVNEVIIFVVGGATREEARITKEFSDSSGIKIVFGSTTFLNTTRFLREIVQIGEIGNQEEGEVIVKGKRDTEGLTKRTKE